MGINKLYCGDCRDILKLIETNSVDAICCDPPYELGFMGKSWDNTGIANDKNMWSECLRVLKPGGHLLSFSGTRTYHRMAVAIEDAGFEVRDMIEWCYGCLSEDTEILTESGYKLLRKLTQYDRIAVYDITNNIYKWERPKRWSIYKVHQDTAYRIKSDYTDQIVSRNHRCLVEREGKLVFIQAEELNEVEYMPTLSDDFYTLQKNSNRKLLLKELLRKGKGLVKTLFSKRTWKEKTWEGIGDGKKSSLERWSNLLEETRKLQADKICEVSEGVFTDGEKRWICNGTSFDNGSILGDMFRENPSSASYQSRPTRQQTGKPDVISIKQGTQITRSARVTKIEYSGIIFCPTVSTGAFIARRNGQVFITGNSGFPKSLNIGKAVDKLQGNEREVVGISRAGSKERNGFKGDMAIMPFETETIDLDITKGTSEWEGWGTALKPAHEPICLARKPLLEKSVAENVLKYGTGGINIDESRVEAMPRKTGTKPTSDEATGSGNTLQGSSKNRQAEYDEQNLGRFPANLIWSHHPDCVETEELVKVKGQKGGERTKTFVGGEPISGGEGTGGTMNVPDTYEKKWICHPECPTKCFPETHSAGYKKECIDSDNNYMGRGKFSGTRIGDTGGNASRFFKSINKSNYVGKVYGQTDGRSYLQTKEHGVNYKDTGNPSEYFKSILYFPKASKSERNKGCDGLEAKPSQLNSGGIGRECSVEKRLDENGENAPTMKNNHPTVKPIALMSYLIKMITPKGGTVLDPFAGSGSTLVAAKENGFQFIGIELTPEYIPIIEARTRVKCEPYTEDKPENIVADLIEKDLPLPIKQNGNTCPCGGKIVKIASGRCCDTCFKDY